jgi:uncharacterized membrane protein YkoI
MGRVLTRIAIAMAVAMLMAAGAAAQSGCIPWKEAGAIIAQNSLIPGNVLYQMVQARVGGKIIHASLCQGGGKFIYKVVVLSATGEVTNLTVDARTGQF